MGNALKAEDVSRFGGGVDSLQDARHGERLLRKNAGRSVVDNGIDPLCRLQHRGIRAGHTIKEGGACGGEIGLEYVAC